MKIAVLVSGEYRTFKYCRHSMTFLDASDVYFSTWSQTVYSNPKIDILITQDVTRDRIISDLGFEPKSILIESSDSIVERRYNSKMIHRWITGYRLIKDSGIRYDRIIITRPDVYINKCNVPSSGYDNSLGVVWMYPKGVRRLPDILMISTMDIMDTIFDGLSIDGWAGSAETNWHIWWYEYCYSKGIEIERAIDFTNCRMYRPIVPSNSTDFEVIFQGDMDWRDLRMLNYMDLTSRETAVNDSSEQIVSNAERKWAEGYYEKYRNYGKDNQQGFSGNKS